MSLFLLLIFSMFFVLMIGIGISIIAWMFLLLGGIRLLGTLFAFGLMLPPISIILAVMLFLTMLFLRSKHKGESSAKYYLLIAFLCLGYIVFQYVVSIDEPLYFSEVVINGQRKYWSNCTISDKTSVFVLLALVVAGGIFYSIFKNDRKM